MPDGKCSKCGGDMEHSLLLDCLWCPACSPAALMPFFLKKQINLMELGRSVNVVKNSYGFDGALIRSEVVVVKESVDEAIAYIEQQGHGPVCSCNIPHGPIFSVEIERHG